MKLSERFNYWHPGHPDVYEETRDGKTFSMVKVDAIRNFLEENTTSYSWSVAVAGKDFVAITLFVEFEDGTMSVPGAASSEYIGLSGLLGEALRNAVLRGLRMGEALYEHTDTHTEAPQTPNYA